MERLQLNKPEVTRVTFQPGDGTRYQLLVFPNQRSADVRVWSEHGLTFDYTFTEWELAIISKNAPEALAANTKEYREAVLDNEWLNEKLFPFAKETAEANPWTFLAAAIVAIEVTTPVPDAIDILTEGEGE